ncbi:MAG TPA: hypothetical protein VMV09_00305 [Candidatus Saccharimonadales bacterium]|nr:hypothetical protein [Candidatus Saccharimonadales bacterium]
MTTELSNPEGLVKELEALIRAMANVRSAARANYPLMQDYQPSSLLQKLDELRTTLESGEEQVDELLRRIADGER